MHSFTCLIGIKTENLLVFVWKKSGQQKSDRSGAKQGSRPIKKSEQVLQE